MISQRPPMLGISPESYKGDLLTIFLFIQVNYFAFSPINALFGVFKFGFVIRSQELRLFEIKVLDQGRVVQSPIKLTQG